MGGSGFIGSNLLENFANLNNYQVISVYNKRKPSIIAKNIQHINIDLMREDLTSLFEQCDTVIHLANLLSNYSILKNNPTGPMIYNTMLNMRILDFSLKTRIKYFIWISSMTGYPNMDNPSEKDYFIGEPSTIYNSVGWMSRYFEKSLNLFSKRENMNVLIIRPTAIYGKYDDFNYETCHLVPYLIRCIVERKNPISIYGNGQNYKDWVYVKDITNFIVKHIKEINGYDVINIGHGKYYSINELIKIICKLDNYNNYNLEYLTPNINSPMKNNSTLNISKINEYYGYNSEYGINDGLKKTINYYRKNRLIS